VVNFNSEITDKRAPLVSRRASRQHASLSPRRSRSRPALRAIADRRLVAPARSPTASLHAPSPRQPPSQPPLSEPRRPDRSRPRRPSPVAHRRRAAVSTPVSRRPAVSRAPVSSRRRLGGQRAAERVPPGRAATCTRAAPAEAGPASACRARVAAGRARAVYLGRARIRPSAPG
jgi:hypothetical protein